MTKRNATSQQLADASTETAPPMAAVTPFGAAVWFEVMTTAGQFLTRRLEEDLKAQQALLASRTPEDVLRLQADYYRTAFEQYSTETNRIIQIMFGAMGGPLTKFPPRFARGYDDVPL